MQNISRVAGTVFAAAALSAVAVPGAHALTSGSAPEVHPVSTVSTAPRHAASAAPRQAAPVAPRGETSTGARAPQQTARGDWWRDDDCDHDGGHCHRRLHDVRCHYKYHRRECVGWDGDRPWRSYDEWWHEGPDHEGLDWSDGPGRYWRDEPGAHWRGLGDGRGDSGWRWRDDGGEHGATGRGTDEHGRVGEGDRPADRGATDAPGTGQGSGNGHGNRSADRGTADAPGTGGGDSRPADRAGAPTDRGTDGDRPSDRRDDGPGRVSDPGAGTPAMGQGSAATDG
ncbi:MAG TPA: hypothetical protein VHV82_07685 [Sporichthyaceae bacterium]|nr:hypothetical protein [Sporichthyaceae bacterium]